MSATNDEQSKYERMPMPFEGADLSGLSEEDAHKIRMARAEHLATHPPKPEQAKYGKPSDKDTEDALANSIELGEKGPQWKAGVVKPEQREPLFTDAELKKQVLGRETTNMSGSGMPGRERIPKYTAWDVRDFYENLITSGELMVVKTVKLEPSDLKENNWANCPDCGKECYAGDNHCRGCGAKIIE